MRQRLTSLVTGLALLPLAGLLPFGAQAQERRAPTSAEEVRLSYAPVVRQVTRAVVNVYAARVAARSNNPLFDDPIFRRFFGMPGQSPAQQVQRTPGPGGSGHASGVGGPHE